MFYIEYFTWLSSDEPAVEEVGQEADEDDDHHHRHHNDDQEDLLFREPGGHHLIWKYFGKRGKN